MTAQSTDEVRDAGSEPSEAEIELGHEIIRFNRVMHRMKAQVVHLLPAGLDPAAALLLAWLVKRGPSRQHELADCTFLDPSTVSRRVSQLVSHGLAERRPDPGDGRAVLLVPTEEGVRLFGLIRTRREELMHQVVGPWPQGEVDEFRRLLRRFNDEIESSSAAIHAHEPLIKETNDHR